MIKLHKASIIVANDRRLINIDRYRARVEQGASVALRLRSAARNARLICVDSAIRANANEHANLESRILVNSKVLNLQPQYYYKRC